MLGTIRACTAGLIDRAAHRLPLHELPHTLAWLESAEAGVDGGRMIATLADEMGYRVIMMVSGPHVLDLLLKANRLDLLYVTPAQVEIPFDEPETVQTILLGGKKIGELQEFRLAHEFIQEDVVTEDGSRISQSFLRYDRKTLVGTGFNDVVVSALTGG